MTVVTSGLWFKKSPCLSFRGHHGNQALARALVDDAEHALCHQLDLSDEGCGGWGVGCGVCDVRSKV